MPPPRRPPPRRRRSARRRVGPAGAAQASPSFGSHAWIHHAVGHVHQQVDYDDGGGEDEDRALHGRIVALGDRVDQVAAHPGPREDRLREDRAAQQPAELIAEHGHHRDERVLQRVLDDHQPLGQPLGACGAHEILPEDLEHPGARLARQHAGAEESEAHGREHQVAEGAGAARRQPRQRDGEDQDEDEPRPEDRRADAGERQRRGQVIDQGCPVHRAHETRADADGRRHDDGGHRQLQRAQEALGELGEDRRGRGDRAPEVAVQHAAQIRRVLHGERLVQAPARAQLVDDLIGGEVAGQQAGGIAGDEPHDREHAHADREQRRNAGGQPAGDQPEHDQGYREAPRLRRGATSDWGFGGHVGAPMSINPRSTRRAGIGWTPADSTPRP